jgi:type II secretory pathway pseudopilin PulG
MEVLAVAAIVGTLAALLMPGLSAARNKSRAAACVNNLRQLGQATLSYHDDYGRLPPLPHSGYLIWQNSAYLLYGQLVPVAERPLGRVFFCPASPVFTASASDTGLRNLGVAGRLTASSYYMRGSDAGAPVRLESPEGLLAADIYFSVGAARNHAGGVNGWAADGSVRFVGLPANWDIESPGAWTDLDAWSR